MVCSSSALALTAMVMACICSLQTTATMAKNLHITHYTHEIQGGPNTSILVAGQTTQPNSAAEVKFGSLIVYDNMMKAGASPDSQLLGRVSGSAVVVVMHTSTPENTTRVQLVVQHIFGEASKYNGFIINVVGIFFYAPVYELSVVGATGLLRGYTGYGLCERISQTTGSPPNYAVYKWDFYLTKYYKK